MSRQKSTIAAYYTKRYDVDGRYGCVLNVPIIHGHLGGGDYRAGMPTAVAVVDDYGTLVFVTPWE